MHLCKAPEAAVWTEATKPLLVHGTLRRLLLLLVSESATFHLAVRSPPAHADASPSPFPRPQHHPRRIRYHHVQHARGGGQRFIEININTAD